MRASGLRTMVLVGAVSIARTAATAQVWRVATVGWQPALGAAEIAFGADGAISGSPGVHPADWATGVGYRGSLPPCSGRLRRRCCGQCARDSETGGQRLRIHHAWFVTKPMWLYVDSARIGNRSVKPPGQSESRMIAMTATLTAWS